MGRRKRKALDDADLDDVEFIDEQEVTDEPAPSSVAATASAAVSEQVDNVSSAASSGISSAAAAGGAGLAAAGAAVGLGGKDDVDEIVDASEQAVSEDSFADAAADIGDIDHDDTISEVDVYLAYGLHGQAEELLTKAIDRDNDNPEYQAKLLETYAAQGNPDGYGEVAANFHQKFGTSHEAWAGIAARGAELDPGNALFSDSGDQVASIGEAPAMGDDDFLSDSPADEIASSTSRGFGGTSEDASASLDDDETHLMDQSIDPAFAFDEADLEATGDFSQIADEIRADTGDDTSSLDFPSFDSSADNISDAASGVAGEVGDKASDAMNDTSLGCGSFCRAGLRWRQ